MIYYGEIIIPAAEREQNELNYSLRALKEYNPRKDFKYKKLKDDLVINAQNFYDGREMVINKFEDKIFPLNNLNDYPEYNSQESDNFIVLEELFTKAGKKLDPNTIEKYFYSDSLRKLYNYLNSSKDNSSHVFMKTRLNSLKCDMKKMPDYEIKEKNLDLPVDSVEEILHATKIIEQQGEGLKIITPKQMIIRLPISLAQLKSGNNSEKLKNEIRQIVYSLYRSKNLSKTIYNNLVNAN